ncbi:DgyrCDS7768 [Dimorphilus gyrociliatus]|uniref:DgyrCDS7768 n=1 Tax=Dimorphilus gyrociliatus TaxID=2664684 RepID=A0A7I8VT38_9ANNE|nr:DgyrCDS7768 [Dimorphilus gyrociliatus]
MQNTDNYTSSSSSKTDELLSNNSFMLKVSKSYQITMKAESHGLLIIWLKFSHKSVQLFERKLKAYIKTMSVKEDALNFNLGMKVLAKYSDKLYYRALIVALTKSRATVFFIDKGKFLTVPIADLTELPKQFSQMPCLVFPATYGYKFFDCNKVCQLLRNYCIDKKLKLFARVKSIKETIAVIETYWKTSNGEEIKLLDKLSNVTSHLPCEIDDIQTIMKHKYEQSLEAIKQDDKQNLTYMDWRKFFANIMKRPIMLGRGRVQLKKKQFSNGKTKDEDTADRTAIEKNLHFTEYKQINSGKKLFKDLVSSVVPIEKKDYVNSWMNDDIKAFDEVNGLDYDKESLNNQKVTWNKRIEGLQKPTIAELQFRQQLESFIITPKYVEDFCHNNILTCLISSVQLPNIIWCQTTGGHYNKILEALKQDQLKSPLNLLNYVTPKKGTILGVTFCDELYRIKIFHKVKQGFLKVLFIDWGCEEVVNPKNCFLLSIETASLPALAFPISVNNITLSEESKEFLEGLDKSCAAIEIVKTNFSPTVENPLLVEFCVKTIDDDSSSFKPLEELLVENGFITKKTSAIDEWEADVMSDEFHSLKNSYEVDIDNPSTVLYNHSTNKHSQACIQFTKRGWCPRGQFCKFEHEKMHSTFTSDVKVIQQPTWKHKTANRVFIVYVTAYSSPSRMFLKILDLKGVQNNDSSRLFKTLSELEHKIRNTLQKRKNTLELLTTGEYVAFDSKTLSRPIRGLVVGISDYLGSKGQCETYEFKIFAIDYGFEECVDERNIFPLNDQFIHFPPSCIEASLKVRSKNGKWSSTDKDLLQNRLKSSGPHLIEICEKICNKYYIEMFDGRDGMDMKKWCLLNLNAYML